MKIINGDVNLKFLSLKDIPDSIAIDECTGFYDVSSNRLTSLKNSPQKVDCFSCAHNNLTSLIGGPKFVNDVYRCENNKLTSLDGIATFIGNETRYSKTLVSSYNKITSLEGYGFENTRFFNFNFGHNNLVSLNGSPQIVESTYQCNNNPITSFIGAPKEIGRYFVADDLPKLNSLDGFPKRVMSNVYLSLNDMLRIFPDLSSKDRDIIIADIKEICEVSGDVYID